MTIDQVLKIVKEQDRQKIRPTVTVKASTPAEREALQNSARKVIRNNRAVLMELKDR